jgi:hypothetical protein
LAIGGKLYAAVAQRLLRCRQHRNTATIMIAMMKTMMVTDGTGEGLPESKKMSTTLKGHTAPAHSVRVCYWSNPSIISFPRPHMNEIKIGKQRTLAAGEYRDSVIRQRRGGKKRSSDTESSSGPSSAPHIENIDDIGMTATACITYHNMRNSLCLPQQPDRMIVP